MSERKVLNKYFPPDFDPSKIPRRKQAADRQQVVRLMAPFSMRCNTCGEYIYKGKKFNARKETALGEDYFGIKIFRFYIKCTQCSAEITFKTDPQNTDYVAEHGASRNFEPWRDAAAVEAASSQDPLERLLAQEAAAEGGDEELDPMKALEARTLDSRREMEILDALQDIRTRNARNEKVDAEELLERMRKRDEEAARLAELEDVERRKAEEEDEQLVRKYFSKALDAQEVVARDDRGKGKAKAVEDEDIRQDTGNTPPSPPPPPVIIKRVRPADDEGDKEPDLMSLLSENARAAVGSTASGRIGGNGVPKTLSTVSSMGPPLAKRKKGANSFGLVKRKQKA